MTSATSVVISHNLPTDDGDDYTDIDYEAENAAPWHKSFNQTKELPKAYLKLSMEEKDLSPDRSSTEGSFCPDPAATESKASDNRSSLSPSAEKPVMVYMQPMIMGDESGAEPSMVMLPTDEPVESEQEESVPESTVIVVNRTTHDRDCPSPAVSASKPLSMRNREAAQAKVRTMAGGKELLMMAVNDFKEGMLEKKSSGLIYAWKQKHCRVGNSQYLIIKNAGTGLLSGFIDFTRTRVEIKSDPCDLAFTYCSLPEMYRLRVLAGDKRSKTFTFRTKTVAELTQWTRAVWLQVERNKGAQWRPIPPSVLCYWKVPAQRIIE